MSSYGTCLSQSTTSTIQRKRVKIGSNEEYSEIKIDRALCMRWTIVLLARVGSAGRGARLWQGKNLHSVSAGVNVIWDIVGGVGLELRDRSERSKVSSLTWGLFIPQLPSCCGQASGQGTCSEFLFETT